MSPTPPPALEVRDLVVRYGGVLAVDRVDLDIPPESLVALVGPSGCGKTSLLRAVAGFERPERGSVVLEGERVAGPGTWVEPERRRVGMVFQEGALFPHLSVGENVRYGLHGRDDGARRAAETLRLVGLEGLGGRYPDELSGGQQQRVALARALAPSPRLVLLDEPFAGLDAGLRARVRQEVRSILRRARTSALLVTHDQEEALSIADRVAVMRRGRLLQVGTPEEIYHLPASPAVAGFVGGGQLVSCRVAAGRCSSAFGVVGCDAPDGPGRLFVRPEDFVLAVGPQGAATDAAASERASSEGAAGEGAPVRGVAGKLLGRSFFGHDALVEVELADGESIAVRVLSATETPIGAEVHVRLRERTYRVFPAES